MKKVFFMYLVISLPTVFSVFSQENNDSLKSIDLQEVQIIATRAVEKVPLTYSNIKKGDFQILNSGQDIPFILTLTPSVVATSQSGNGVGYTGFRIRGTDASRINITSNGIPMNDSESQEVFWVNIPDFASSVKDLQIQRGVGTSTNGTGAFGASINMKTDKISLQSYGELNLGYGTFNTSKTSLKVGTGKIKNHWAIDMRLSAINSDGYIDRASTNLKSYFTQAGYFGEKTLLKLIVFGGKETTYHAWDGVPEDILKNGNRKYNPSGYMGNDTNGKPMFYDNQNDNYLQTNYQLSWMEVVNSELNLHLALHYTKGDGFYEEYKQNRKLIEYGLSPFEFEGEKIKKSDLVRKKHLDNNFGGGIFSINYKKNKTEIVSGGSINRYQGDHFGHITWIKDYVADPRFTPTHEYYRNHAKKTDANLFIKLNQQLNSQWNAFADIQYRYINYNINGQNDDYDESIEAMQKLDYNNQFNFFNPKAGLFFRMNSTNDLYVSLAIGNREPSRNNYTDGKLAGLPKAETLFDYEFGYKINHKSFQVGINLYYMKYKDQLILTGEVNEIGEMLTSNIPDSYRTGIEITAGMPISSFLKWNGNVTFSNNKIKKYTEYINNYTTGKQETNYLGTTTISFSPGIIANSLLLLDYQSWTAGIQSSYVGKQYLDNSESNNRKLDPYFINNLMLGYKFHFNGIESLSLNILINNLFNEKYESNGYVYDSWYEGNDPDLIRKSELRYFPQAGTNIMANISVRF